MNNKFEKKNLVTTVGGSRVKDMELDKLRIKLESSN